MFIRSLPDFNGAAPWFCDGVLVGTATVAAQKALVADQVIELGTPGGHWWGLSHGQGTGTVGHRWHDARAHGWNPGGSDGSRTKATMARLRYSSSRAAIVYQHAAAKRDRLMFVVAATEAA